jgi:cytochrome P450
MSDDGLSAADRVFYEKHFNYMDPRETALRETAVKELASQCPVVQSDAWGGFLAANNYSAVTTAYHEWSTFSSTLKRFITTRPDDRPQMPPIDFDPPVQRDYRRILNPYLTPKRVVEFEPGIRAMVTELIDGFIENGSCDLSPDFARPFPGRMLYKYLFGIDDAEVPKVQTWTYQMTDDPLNPETPQAQRNWNQWVRDLIVRRRSTPRQDDMIDGLLHARVDGQALSDDDLVGCIQILILGGFSTTTDSMLNTMLRLAQDPVLQDRLRNDLGLIPKALDEFFRFDPPVSGVPRVCLKDTVLDGTPVKAGDRVYLFMASANRDPAEFESPNVIDIDRERNRHLAFGLGVHRCIGSNVARMNLRIALEELLTRMGEFGITPGAEPTRHPTPVWGLTSLPLSFKPGPRLLG